MELVSKVRRVMKSLINANKNLKISRDADVFNEIAFDFSFNKVSYGNQRQMGTFTIQYLVSPNPNSTSTAPSITYDQIISAFDKQKSLAFKEAELILFSCSYENGDVITDPSGSVSLSFTINIQVMERTQ